jgi:hypothetical protein
MVWYFRCSSRQYRRKVVKAMKDVFSNFSNGSVVAKHHFGEYQTCLIRHSVWSFYYCGYVAVPKSNKYFGLDYETIDSILQKDLSIYSSKNQMPSITLSELSSFDSHWIFGFDTAGLDCSRKDAINQLSELLNVAQSLGPKY